jgi:hypothetical protein
MAVTLDEPCTVVPLDERRDIALGVREIREPVQPQALLLQRPHVALDDPVALWFPDERRIPSHRSSAPNARAVYCGPQSLRIVSPLAMSLRNPPNAYRTPWGIGLQGGPPITLAMLGLDRHPDAEV